MIEIGWLGNIIDGFFLVLGKSGKFLNARGHRICFVLEAICLCYWFWIDIERGLYSQAAGALVSASIAFYGFRRWKKHPPVQLDRIPELMINYDPKNIP